MIRTILAVICAILYLVLTLPVMGILALLGLKNPEIPTRAATVMIKWIFGVILKIAGTKITVKGLENIPKDRAVLYIGNHRSIFDILVTYIYLPGITGYVGKDSMKKIPIFRVWFKWITALFLDRTNLKDGMRMLKEAIGHIKDGKSVFIFPEGTRNKQDSELPLLEFHEGSFRIATNSGCPIIPVAINNTADILNKHLPRLKPVHVILEFGTPIDPTVLSRPEQKHLGSTVREVLSGMIAENAKLV